MGGYGCRNMYRLTGQPGWMRLGCSPGWAWRSPSGLGPCAEYLMSGQWPTSRMAQSRQTGPAEGFGNWAPFAGSPEQELEFLKKRAEFLARQLEAVRERIEDLERE